jgi:hypothetical protein
MIRYVGKPQILNGDTDFEWPVAFQPIFNALQWPKTMATARSCGGVGRAKTGECRVELVRK